MGSGSKIVIVIVVLLGVLGMGFSIYYISQYNHAIELEVTVKTQWAQVESQLKRRYDLIPNLVETVKGYAKHEKELFENIANARTKYFQPNQTTDQKVAASKQLDGLLSRLLLLKETYPELKANQSFLKLQDSIEGTENRIAVERKRYNDVVKELNTYVRTFPGSFFASMAGVQQASYYEVPAEQKETPKVKF
jgi:LemA protein